MEHDNVPFHKYVQINDHDILLAICEGLRPMQTIHDAAHAGLPYFGNDAAGFEPIGNTHDSSLSVSHVPGRWLDALLNAGQLPGMIIDQTVIGQLAEWAYTSVEAAGMGLPAQLDLQTFQMVKCSNLHNLREVMHAFCALYQYRQDERAKRLALSVIEAVDRYYVSQDFRFDEAGLLRDTGGKITGAGPFPLTFGRYIGPLVKFYCASHCEEALKQAIRLKDYCFEHVLPADDSYDLERLGKHTHSVTSMLSSLALLGEVTQDRAVLDRVARFVDHGLRSCTLDFGWCLVGYLRDDLMGEINNTADILAICLTLGRAGYPGFYARAERILRAHLLPAQLLDTHFIPPQTDPNDANRYLMHEQSRGAFGFPSPYGHEYEPGSRISFNWDVVGGAVSELCAAYHAIVSWTGQGADVNLLFDFDHPDLQIRSSYPDHSLSLLPGKDMARLTVRLPESFHIESVSPDTAQWTIEKDRLLLADIRSGVPVLVRFVIDQRRQSYTFRTHQLDVLWEGERIIAMSSAGKRLCFFPELAPAT